MKKILVLFLTAIIFVPVIAAGQSDDAIQPWAENHWYWQYKGEPVMLLGASDDDNLFQWPAEMLIPQLDSMKTVGANYVRCTLSDRQDRGFEAYPFAKLENGKYDLNQSNKDYYRRFDFFLQETRKRDIIVQIEVWDRFDYSRNNWPQHPFNPENNVNYTSEESGLELEYPDHPGRNVQPFFFTTPEQRNIETVLQFQKKRVEQILDVAFKYRNVLYCIDNETSGEEEWATFWAEFIQNKADEAGKKICITQMWDAWDLTSEQHKRTFDHPERYAFCDVSQNNQKMEQEHWDNFQKVREYISTRPRPMNTVKTYGADGGRHGNTKNGIERWWRHVLGGAASARFHRPESGLGLSELSMNCVKVARKIEKIVPFWEFEAGNVLLSEREENEAYIVSKTGEAYILFFTDGGEIQLDLSGYSTEFAISWADIRTGKWTEENALDGGELVTIAAPGINEWVAVIYSK